MKKIMIAGIIVLIAGVIGTEFISFAAGTFVPDMISEGWVRMRS